MCDRQDLDLQQQPGPSQLLSLLQASEEYLQQGDELQVEASYRPEVFGSSSLQFDLPCEKLTSRSFQEIDYREAFSRYGTVHSMLGWFRHCPPQYRTVPFQDHPEPVTANQQSPRVLGLHYSLEKSLRLMNKKQPGHRKHPCPGRNHLQEELGPNTSLPYLRHQALAAQEDHPVAALRLPPLL